jgi:flagellar motor switch protein FliG
MQESVSEKTSGEAKHQEIALIKTTAEPPKEGVYRRAAKFLMLIGVDEAAKVFTHLDESQKEKIIPEIASLKRIDFDEAVEILSEFQSLLQRSRETGGVQTARVMLQKAFGDDAAEKVLRASVPFPDGEPFEYLAEFDGERLYALLRDESIEVMTLVLSRLKPALSATAISHMKDSEKTAVVKRLAKMEKVAPQVIKTVDARLHEKTLKANVTRTQKLDGSDALAQILRRMTPNDEKNILDSLSDADPLLAQDLRQKLFTTDDIIGADDKFIQAELRIMRDEDVVLLMAGKENAFRKKILGNVSKGRGERLLEDERLGKPFKKTDCDGVSAEFFTRLRTAWEEGKMRVADRDEEYV